MNEPQINKKEIDEALDAINSAQSGDKAPAWRRAFAFVFGLVGHLLLAVLLGAFSAILLALAFLTFPVGVPFVYLAAAIGGTNGEADG